jgi:predicted ester cyclase
MGTEENKAIYRQFIEEVFNHKDLSRIGDFIGSDMVEHTPNFPSGLEGAKQGIGAFVIGFPDLHITIEVLIAEGDKVVARLTQGGTHRGEFAGVPPTGKEVSIAGIDIWRLSEGKCAEHWLEMDNLGLMQQLGVIPVPEQARA